MTRSAPAVIGKSNDRPQIPTTLFVNQTLSAKTSGHVYVALSPLYRSKKLQLLLFDTIDLAGDKTLKVKEPETSVVVQLDGFFF